MEAALRQPGIPLYSLESKHPLVDFDIVGFSLPYETLYTNTLNICSTWLAYLLFSAERDERHPLVIAGGHAAYNPEPMHAFIDAFVIGEGEEVIDEIVDAHQAWKHSGRSRSRTAAGRSLKSGVCMSRRFTRRITSRTASSSDREAGPGSAAAGGQAHRRQTAAAHHPLHGPVHRHGPQPGPDRNHARLHAWLPFLPCRDDHPPGARAPGG